MLGLLCIAVLSLSLALVGSASARDLTSMTIEESHDALVGGKLTSVRLTRAFLARIEKYEPYYNAMVAMNKEALKDARAADARRRANKSRSFLDGVPVVIKDSIDVKGLPTTGGWLSKQSGGINLVPSHDAPVVARLRKAGAILIGKTNLPAFSGSGENANTSWAGPTFSVLNRNWAPGGSSTGTAAAVAADFATAGLGEETGGSIQNPSAAESLVGVKPTFALVPNSGVQPLAGSSRDVVGPIAKTVADAADILNVIAGYTLKDPKTTAALDNVPAGGYKAGLSTTALGGARLGLYGPGWRKDDPLSPETVKLYEGAVATLEGLGATAVADPFAGSGFAAIADTSAGFDPRGLESLPFDMNNYLRNLGPSSPVHSAKQLGKALGVGLFDPKGPMGTFVQLSPDAEWSAQHLDRAPDLSSFRQGREKYLRVFNQVMDANHLDALAFPQATAEIGKLYGGKIDSTTVSEINIAGLPAVVVPAGKYADGKPFSLEFVGRPWSEGQLLGLAYAFEQATHARVVPGKLATTPGPKPPSASGK